MSLCDQDFLRALKPLVAASTAGDLSLLVALRLLEVHSTLVAQGSVYFAEFLVTGILFHFFVMCYRLLE